MAPSTPPPPSSVWLAAFTMASTASVVMSATSTSSCAGPTSAVRRGVGLGMVRLYACPGRSAARSGALQTRLRAVALSFLQTVQLLFGGRRPETLVSFAANRGPASAVHRLRAAPRAGHELGPLRRDLGAQVD